MPSEEFHHSQQEGQRPVQQETTVALGGVATQGDAEVPEGAWDHQKAETMAAALQEKPKAYVRDAEGEIARDENGPVLVDAENGATLMDESRYRTFTNRHRDARGQAVDPLEKQSVDERLAALRAIVNDEEASPYDRERAQHDLNTFNEYANEKIENSLSPLAAFYDLNPDKFANMPTRDFMELAKNYETISRRVSGNEQYSPWYQRTIAEYEGMLEKGSGKPEMADKLADLATKLFSHRESYFRVTNAFSEYAKEHDWPSDSIRSNIIDAYKLTEIIEQQFEKTLEGSFDKTPRQIIEEQLAILKDYQELAQRSHAEDAAAKQRIEDEARATQAE